MVRATELMVRVTHAKCPNCDAIHIQGITSISSGETLYRYGDPIPIAHARAMAGTVRFCKYCKTWVQLLFATEPT